MNKWMMIVLIFLTVLSCVTTTSPTSSLVIPDEKIVTNEERSSLDWAPYWLGSWLDFYPTESLSILEKIWIDTESYKKVIALTFPPPGLEEQEKQLSKALLAEFFRSQGLWVDAYPLYQELYRYQPHGALAFREYYHYQGKDPNRAKFYFQRIGSFTPQGKRELDLYYFLKKQWAFESLTEVNQQLIDKNISIIHKIEDDFWIGTWNGGLLRYSLSEGRGRSFFESRGSIAPRTVRSIHQEKDILYVATFQGIFRYHTGRDLWQNMSFPPEIPSERLQVLVFWKNRPLIGTLGSGLLAWENESWEKVSSRELQYITALAPDPDAPLLWIGTLNNGVFVMDEEGRLSRPFSKKVDNVIFFHWDKNKTLWMGTYGNGLYQYEKNNLHSFQKGDGTILDNWVLSVVESPQGLYFGTFGQGLIFFNGEDWKRHSLWDAIPSQDISSLSFSQGRLFIGTLGEGVLIWNEDWEHEK